MLTLTQDGAKVVVHLQKTTTLSRCAAAFVWLAKALGLTPTGCCCCHVCVYSTFVEIIGRVNSDGTVDEQRSVSFGDKFGMSSSVVCRSAAQHSES